jgi:excisionase family DNA binding protein
MTPADLLRCPNCGKPKPPTHWFGNGNTHCRTRQTWTQARLFRLMTLLEAGRTDEQIARELGTTPVVINLARKRRGIPSRTETLLSAGEVARRMGFGCGKKVTWLIGQGWLRGRRGQRRGPNRQWYVRPEDLLAFLDDPAHWSLWEVERIADETLRRYAEKVRGGVRYLTQSEVAERLFVDRGTVQQWIDKGWLPASRHGRSNRLVREDDVAAFERPGIRRRLFVMEAIATLRRRGLTQKEIGLLYGTDSGHVGEWARGRWEPLRLVADRFAVLLQETAHLPESEQLSFRWRRPLPGFDELVARIRPLIEEIQ